MPSRLYVLWTQVQPESNNELSELLRRLKQQGDLGALGRIIDLTWEGVFRAARHRVRDPQAAEDLTQEVFSLLCRRYSSIREENRLQSWLYGATIRMARDHRPRRGEIVVPPDVLALLHEAGDSTESPLERICRMEREVEREEVFRRACEGLDPRLRRCVELTWVEGCSRSETAKRLGVSVKTVWQYMSRAVAHIATAVRSQHHL